MENTSGVVNLLIDPKKNKYKLERGDRNENVVTSSSSTFVWGLFHNKVCCKGKLKIKLLHIKRRSSL